MKRAIMILGGGILQIPIIQSSIYCGYYTIVVDGNRYCLGREIAHCFSNIDLSHTKQLILYAVSINKIHPVEIAVTAGTDFIYASACINNILGLTGLSPHHAIALTNKFLMRKKLHGAGLSVPKWHLLHKNNIHAVKSQVDFTTQKYILKPVDSMGSRGVRMISSIEELYQYMPDTQQHSARNATILEEYIIGNEYSIDALINHSRVIWRGVAIRHIYFKPYFVEMGHTINHANSRDINTLKRNAKRTIRAFDIKRGSAKFDIFLTEKGAVVCEIAGRLSGGFMSGWSYPLASGRNPAAELIAIHTKTKRYRASQKKNIICGERAMLSLPGIIHTIDGVDVTRKSVGVSHVFVSKRVGEQVVFPKNNVDKVIHIIVCAPTHTQFIERSRIARSALTIRLCSANIDTCNFLFSKEGRSYPMAYSSVDSSQAHKLADSLIASGAHCRFSHIISNRQFINGAQKYIDWHDMSFFHALKMLEKYPNIKLLERNKNFQKLFVRAIFKGSVQGGLFLIDTLSNRPNLLRKWTDKWDGEYIDG